jgi:hypothetical protein
MQGILPTLKPLSAPTVLLLAVVLEAALYDSAGNVVSGSEVTTLSTTHLLDSEAMPLPWLMVNTPSASAMRMPVTSPTSKPPA